MTELGPHPFRDLTTVDALGDGRWRAHIHPTWTIGPKVHGGCMLAVCAAAARRTLLADDTGDSAIQPLAVSASFVAAPDAGDVDLITTVRKQGKQVSLVDVELVQGDRVAVRASITLGRPDEGDDVFAAAQPLADLPAEPTLGSRLVTPEHPMGKIVNVSGGADLCVDETSAHFLAGRQGEPVVRMWARPRAEDEADRNTAALFALMAGDISAPVAMNLGRFGWAPTVQLTAYLRRLPQPGWLRVMASSTVLGGTWFEEDHTVVDSTGAVVVQSRQLAMMPR
ncbi:thioesterase family protein [Rhodococcus sp. CX]|uniref:thioesterase family protein n=1 Tax=Rhodococcus sp. CX TaxID=2789880 RepID=UPI0018CD6B49|nr:thioesterase family protein [Rhodococcus sp. CX]MBH0118624.1 thioesterase family protein [Rhodococcus sp. CX]